MQDVLPSDHRHYVRQIKSIFDINCTRLRVKCIVPPNPGDINIGEHIYLCELQANLAWVILVQTAWNKPIALSYKGEPYLIHCIRGKSVDVCHLGRICV